ncbi:AraC family transcriptional regulator [Agrobacterium tumefaciens]|nr:AraC family transcriptional regulator [Agrobacterium tumefaciens]NTE22091.1 AraC family transcriptional regulator [Agrobacterium tumefaciens]
MAYLEIQPHPALQSYIDAYWISEITSDALNKTKILPDGCVDIIFNIEDDYRTESGTILMKSEAVYLIGTMMCFKEYKTIGKAKLLGVRFKPGAFSYFFKLSSLDEFTDQSIELKDIELPVIHRIDEYTSTYLDHFFIHKLSPPKYSIIPIIKDIQQQNGQLRVSDLAMKHFTTSRQLERHFKNLVGISPKDFIGLVRYQFASKKIKNNTSGKCLAELAIESGYYDHAHFTKEIKRFTGSVPSQL